MGSHSKQKGSRREREFAKKVGGRRVPLSGAGGYRFKSMGEAESEAFVGDVVSTVAGAEFKWECKSRADGFKSLYEWLEGVDGIGIIADRREWLVCLPLDTFLALVDHGK